MSTVSNGTGLHTCVGEEEEGFKRRAWGRGRRGEGEVEEEGTEREGISCLEHGEQVKV